MKLRATLRRLARQIREPPPGEIRVRWVADGDTDADATAPPRKPPIKAQSTDKARQQ